MSDAQAPDDVPTPPAIDDAGEPPGERAPGDVLTPPAGAGASTSSVRSSEGLRAWLLGVALAILGPVARLAWFLRANATQIADPGPVFVAMGVGAAVCTLLAVGFARASKRSPITTGAVFGAIGYLFFGASIFGSDPVQRPVVWLVVVAVVAVGVGDLARRKAPLAILAVLAVGASAFGLVGFARERPEQVERRVSGAPAAPTGGAERTPDVWFFLTDGFGRADQLRRVVDHDAAPFEAALEQRGFEVDPAATVNYPETDLSVPSMLEQRLPVVTTDDLSKTTQIRGAVRGGNRTVDELEALGYRYVHAAPGLIDWLGCDRDVADLCVDPGARERVRFGESARSVLDLTPLGPALRASAEKTDPVSDPEQVVEEVLDRRTSFGSDPMFVYSHLMSPHPPYRVDASCRARSPWIGGVAGGWPDDQRSAYADATACLERQLERAIDRIISEDPDAIVIVAGDHDPGFGLSSEPLENWTEDQLAERFAAFRAVRMPDACRSDDERASSAVNLFRVVVACLRGDEPQLVEPRAFLTFGGGVEELPSAQMPPS